MNSGNVNRTSAAKMAVTVAVVLLVCGVYLLKKAQESGGTVVAGTTSNDLHVTSPIDFKALRALGLPVIIDFGADSCIPCKEMAPILVELNKALEGKAIIKFVDVWKYRDLSAGVPIQVIPTQVFFDANGKPFTPDNALGIPFNRYSDRNTKEHVFTTHEGGLDKPQMLAILAEMGMK